jgi:biopolymer transport protein ExbB
LASSTDISSGMYQSLLTTAAGLAVAIPSFVGYSYLSARVNTLMRDMERGGIEIVHLITAQRNGGEIIEFGAARQRDAAIR